MSTSVLDDIKLFLGLDPEDDSFDVEILVHLNTGFAMLTELGVGPPEGVHITDRSTKWSDVYENPRLDHVRGIVGIHTRLLFDPPMNSFVTASLERLLEEMKYRVADESREVKSG